MYLFLLIFGCAEPSLMCADFSLVAPSRGSANHGTRVSHYGDFSCCRAHELQYLRIVGSAVMARRLSCSVACGIFPDQGSNWCPLCCRTDS